jgi:hypothetical protein
MDSRSPFHGVGNDRLASLDIPTKKARFKRAFVVSSRGLNRLAALAALKLGLGVELAARRGVIASVVRRGGGAGGNGNEKGGGERRADDLGHGCLLTV